MPLHEPFGPIWLLGVVLAVVLCTFLPLRGGNGQHAEAGPGALTVRNLIERGLTEHHALAAQPSPPDAREFAPRPVPEPRTPPTRTVPEHPEATTERTTEIQWPLDDPDHPRWFSACEVSLQPKPYPPISPGRNRNGPSLVEQDIAELLGCRPHPDSLGPEAGYIGRHRLLAPA
ncbi:hypothetical protein SAMN04487820_11077 [Actinopolyspora mzabensis]|uniref:Uncharacterized protein n=1 Tax=Actinopolyspora mzabensis TaxID=995066 RepID=A0A1G9DGE3_ACTMZ|nr:hypothetical protein [Actinopolyspora mzabensis]SDK62928.1 hypothetical protein SAMN04487820_11077 [Actinopolyspora mzabensis]